jgi:hypothetical protein
MGLGEGSAEPLRYWSNSKVKVQLEAFTPELKQVGTTVELSILTCRLDLFEES